MKVLLQVGRSVAPGLVVLAVVVSPSAWGQQDPATPGEARTVPQLGFRLDDDPSRRDVPASDTVVEWSDQETLGLTLTSIEPALRAQLDLSAGEGLLVLEVAPESPAAEAGLQPNDLVLTIADRPVRTIEEVRQRVETAQEAGKDLEIQYLRAGKRGRTVVALSSREDVAPKDEPEADQAADDDAEFWLGVAVRPVGSALRSHLDIPEGQGLVVLEVAPGTPADRAGLKPNDILLSLDEQPLTDIASLKTIVQKTGHQNVALRVLRTGQAQEFWVSPERRDEDGLPNRVSKRGDRFPFLGPDIVIKPDGDTPIRMRILPGGPMPPGFPAPPFVLPPNPFAVRPPFPVESRLQRVEGQLKELRQSIEDLRKEIQKHETN